MVDRWIDTGVKPLSANKAFQGRKVKTRDYRGYEKTLIATLPDLEVPEGPLHLKLVVRYSSKLADIDNALKPFIDILQKRYGFNDRFIFKLTVIKEIVPKGAEKILFKVETYEQK